MLEERVREALDILRPSLQADGGDVELISVSEDGKVSVKLTGASDPNAAKTMRNSIGNYLKAAISEVTEIVSV